MCISLVANTLYASFMTGKKLRRLASRENETENIKLKKIAANYVTMSKTF